MIYRVMYDAVDWTMVPDTAELVAGYVSGPYRWPKEAWEKFADVPTVEVAVQAWDNIGNCLIVQPNHALPQDVPDWLIKARARDVIPSVYCAQATRRHVIEACRARGVVEPYFWVRNWDRVAALPSGAIAKQYAAHGIYDLSVVADHWPGVDPPR